MDCCFVSDLHGKSELYERLVEFTILNKPDALFIGGDVTSNPFSNEYAEGFFSEYLANLLLKIQNSNKSKTEIFLILGNDDAAAFIDDVNQLKQKKLLHFLNSNSVTYRGYDVFGYSFVPPTPFMLKDWEKYDVSRYVDPGCLSPEEGIRTVPVPDNVIKYSTISEDLNLLAGDKDLSKAIFLFHTPPHKTNLDRVANEGKFFEHVPLENHVGSIAVRRFIEIKQPMVTLHGHIHESTRLTGKWSDKIGNTFCFNAANDSSQLALVRFETDAPENAVRILI